MKIIIIAAVAKNRVIGKAGKMPWHISEDLKRFKRLTMGHTLLMGRRTYESIGKPLEGRRNVVLSSRPLSGVESYISLAEVLKNLASEEKIFVIGGGEIYRQILPLADEMHLTLIDREVEGDTYFPEYEHLIGTTFAVKNADKRDGYTFVDYVRIVSRAAQS
ncbi:MAG: dihydrofolate reductase [Ignavibacteria bacterium]|nr:dihydrofolate reductase [Ignavibacteria bacterium]